MLQEIPLLSLILYNIGVKFSSSQAGPSNKTPSTPTQTAPPRHWRDSRPWENLERKWSIFSLARWRIEFSFLDIILIVKILKKKFSFSSRNSRFWRKISLLKWMRFCKHILFLFSRFKILREKVHFLLSIFPLNFSSNSREKSKFAILVDFDQQCFAERESISKRQFCVVEQYSFFSQQKHFMETSNKSLLWEYFERLHNGKTI